MIIIASSSSFSSFSCSRRTLHWIVMTSLLLLMTGTTSSQHSSVPQTQKKIPSSSSSSLSSLSTVGASNPSSDESAPSPPHDDDDDGYDGCKSLVKPQGKVRGGLSLRIKKLGNYLPLPPLIIKSPAKEEEEKELAALAVAATAATQIRGGSTLTSRPSSPPSSTTTRTKSSPRRSSRLRSIIIPSKDIIPELIGECFGTFILLNLILGIVPSAVLCNSMVGVFPIAILTGIGIPIACSVVASKSPASHFNPIITWSMCLYRKFGWNKLLPYSLAQMIGATIASIVNYILYEPYIKQYEQLHGLIRTSIDGGGLQIAKIFACYYKDPITSIHAMMSEIWGTFILTSVVFALTSQQNTEFEIQQLFIPAFIGGVVALIICIIGPISCASLNPAREIGPRLALYIFGWSSNVAFHQLPIYIISAVIGSTVGGFFIDYILYRKPKSVVELQESQQEKQNEDEDEQQQQQQQQGEGLFVLDQKTM